MTLTPGTKIGPYEVTGAVGAGGMGEVYRAHDARLGRDVAIKVLPESVSKDPVALARFEREARAVGALSHPNIVNIFDVGSERGISYVVMELLEGETLRARLHTSVGPAQGATKSGTGSGSHVGLPRKKALDVAIYTGSVGSPDLTLVVPGRISEVTLGTREIFYRRGTDLVAQAFDVAAANVSGDPRVLSDHVSLVTAAGDTLVSYAPPGGLSLGQRIAWVARDGKELSQIGVSAPSGTHACRQTNGRSPSLARMTTASSRYGPTTLCGVSTPASAARPLSLPLGRAMANRSCPAAREASFDSP